MTSNYQNPQPTVNNLFSLFPLRDSCLSAKLLQTTSASQSTMANSLKPHHPTLQNEIEAFAPSTTTISASSFRNEPEFKAHVHELIQGITRPSILVCTDVDPYWVQETFQAVDEVYSTR
jgi:hypothetical protein